MSDKPDIVWMLDRENWRHPGNDLCLKNGCRPLSESRSITEQDGKLPPIVKREFICGSRFGNEAYCVKPRGHQLTDELCSGAGKKWRTDWSQASPTTALDLEGLLNRINKLPRYPYHTWQANDRVPPKTKTMNGDGQEMLGLNDVLAEIEAYANEKANNQ